MNSVRISERYLPYETEKTRGNALKTLYVSDLDGTLLRSDERISDFTNNVINRMTANGRLFSYATARSIITAKKMKDEEG